MLKQEAGITTTTVVELGAASRWQARQRSQPRRLGCPLRRIWTPVIKKTRKGLSGPALKAESAFAVVQKHDTDENETYRPQPHNDSQLIPLEAQFQPARP